MGSRACPWLQIGATVELPEARLQKKIKSMQVTVLRQPMPCSCSVSCL